MVKNELNFFEENTTIVIAKVENLKTVREVWISLKSTEVNRNTSVIGVLEGGKVVQKSVSFFFVKNHKSNFVVVYGNFCHCIATL